jgi:2-hydroxychromene-2-carboxylate isomerase
MPNEPLIEFWFSIASTYTYLSVSRLSAFERTRSCRFVWRPFSVRTIMNEQNNSPFRDKPIKAAYMWRDIERRAGLYGIPFRGRVPYPIQEAHLANQVAVLGAREGWCASYTVARYRRWFLDLQEPGSEPNLSDTLREIGQDPDRVIATARSTPIVAGDRRGACPGHFRRSHSRRGSRTLLERRPFGRRPDLGPLWHAASGGVLLKARFRVSDRIVVAIWTRSTEASAGLPESRRRSAASPQ